MISLGGALTSKQRRLDGIVIMLITPTAALVLAAIDGALLFAGHLTLPDESPEGFWIFWSASLSVIAPLLLGRAILHRYGSKPTCYIAMLYAALQPVAYGMAYLPIDDTHRDTFVCLPDDKTAVGGEPHMPPEWFVTTTAEVDQRRDDQLPYLEDVGNRIDGESRPIVAPLDHRFYRVGNSRGLDESDIRLVLKIHR